MKRNLLFIVYCLLLSLPAGAQADQNVDQIIIKNVSCLKDKSCVFYKNQLSKNNKALQYIKGDVNQDGIVDVADISSIITVMAAGDLELALALHADVNGDGWVDVADIASVISIMASTTSNLKDSNVNCNDTSLDPAYQRLEFPHVKDGSVVLVHSTNDQYGINYSVEWDPQKKAQRWSCYQLDKRTLQKYTSRYYSQNNQYPHDPLLHDSLYLSQDCFWNSGFDHGHICPSADRLYSEEANYQTFFLTNMQPQYKAFNGSLSGCESYKNDWSPWYRLETQVRSWANANVTETLYVVKGGTIEDDQILPDKVKGEMCVPKYFFVALLLKNAQGYKAIGFWMEHKGSYDQKLPLADYAVNIAELELLTGIDFFCNLPDDVEQRVENLPIENVKRAWGL